MHILTGTAYSLYRVYVQSFITEAIAKVWVKGCIPNEWKKAVTILIHNKGESEGSGKFSTDNTWATNITKFYSMFEG